MKLKKLVLQNFMGVRDLTIEAGGKDISIFGANAAGKTTVASALSFLLFGKDCHGNTKFDIKTLGADGEAIHNLEHGVAGVFDVGGKEVAFTKAYKEKWTQKRGSKAAEFTGHMTEHWVDDVPFSEKAYKTKVAEIAPEELFRLLTSPNYFPSVLPWQERRKLLMEICGDVSDLDVIASDEELSPLAEIERSIEDQQKVVKESMKKINEALKSMPVRIDEARRQIPEEPGDKVAEERLVASLNESLKKCQSEYARVQAGENTEQKRELAKLEDAVADIVREFQRQKAADEAEADRRHYESSKAVREMQQAVDDDRLALERLRQRNVADEITAQVANLHKYMADLRAEWEGLNPQQYTPGDCPTCGQAMPEDDEAEAAFNARKANRLSEIQAQGKKHKAEVERLEKERDTLAAKHAEECNAKAQALAQLERQLADMKDAPAKIQKELDAIRERKVEEVPEHQAAAKALDTAKQALVDQDNTMELERLSAKATKIEADIAAARERMSAIKQGEDAQARVDELESEEKAMAKKWEDLTHQLYLLEQFTRKKVSLLEDKINGRFELARFKLFENHISGGLKECCEVLFGGVPYTTNLNNGARINVGLDIIRTLSAHYGVQLPVIIDNAESVTDLLEIDAQVIRLVVSADDKTLRIEAE